MTSTERIEEIAHLNQGHQITEEEIYNSFGEIPIYTGNNELVGYVDTQIVDEDDLPCISYPTKGQVGNFYVHNEVFEANNTAVLTLKEEWEDEINIYWLISQLSPKVKKAYNSKKGVGYIGKDIMERIEVDIPDKDRQDRIGSAYKELKKAISQINEIINSVHQIREESKTSLNQGETARVGDIFEFKSGRGLTERVIYENPPLNEEDVVQIYSGATVEENRLGKISKKAQKNVDELKLFEAPAILVVRKGLAGEMKYLEEGIFTTNDDVYVLKLKEEWKERIDLKWFSYQYQELFKRITTSKTDNATFNKSYAKKQEVIIPPIERQDQISQELKKVDHIIDRLTSIKVDAEHLLDYLIV